MEGRAGYTLDAIERPPRPMSAVSVIPNFKPLGRRLMDAAAEIFECRRDLKGHGQAALHARYAVMVILRECDWSLPRIGARVGLEHTSVMAALRASDELVATNGFYAGALYHLRQLATEYVRSSPRP